MWGMGFSHFSLLGRIWHRLIWLFFFLRKQMKQPWGHRWSGSLSWKRRKMLLNHKSANTQTHVCRVVHHRNWRHISRTPLGFSQPWITRWYQGWTYMLNFLKRLKLRLALLVHYIWGCIMVAFLCRLHLLIWSFLAVSPKRFTWLVECSILQKPTPSSSKDMKSWGKKTQAPTEALCLCFFTFLWQLCNEGSSPAAARRSSSAWQDIKSEKTPWVATKCYKCPLPSSLPHVLPRPGATNAIRNTFYMCIVYMEILQFRLCD